MKNKIFILVCALIFGGLGVYLTFFAGNVDKYDSQTKAYKIDPNESYDSDDTIIYTPTYYFRIDRNEYECRAKSGSSTYPNEKKNTVYYDSSDPTKCLTEYEKSTSKVTGIICLVFFAIIFFFGIVKTPQYSSDTYHQTQDYGSEGNYPVDSEQAEKVMGIINKVGLIYKRVILGIIIIVLLVITLFDTGLLKQTIKAKDYIDTTAIYKEEKESGDDSIFKDYIYTFTDKQGNEQEITVSIASDNEPEYEIPIKYNEKDPQDFYEEGSTLDKKGITWYIVKIVAIILLIVLFFNKKLLNKIGISGSISRN